MTIRETMDMLKDQEIEALRKEVERLNKVIDELKKTILLCAN